MNAGPIFFCDLKILTFFVPAALGVTKFTKDNVPTISTVHNNC